MNVQHRLKIAIVAGELSGDLLAAGLMSELKKCSTHIDFVGVGGPKMQQEGLQSLVDIERLAVMGFGDVLKRYPELYRIRHKLYQQWLESPPDVFIGIDYPSFNLSLAARLKRHGIKTVHFISPKVWAWRQNRVFAIKKAIDLMLTVFPFEAQFYQKHQVPVQFVGHPLADAIPLKVDGIAAKKQLGYTVEQQLIAVLPGSRMGEMKYMAPLFLEVMRRIAADNPDVCFVVPIANYNLRQAFEQKLCLKTSSLNMQIVDGQSHEAMAAADLILTKSGTATLEAMLLKRPMVVAYKCGTITHALIAAQLKVPFVALPNLLAGKYLVPEFIQRRACAKGIARQISEMLADTSHQELKKQFMLTHLQLRQDASKQAAQAIMNLLDVAY